MGLAVWAGAEGGAAAGVEEGAVAGAEAGVLAAGVGGAWWLGCAVAAGFAAAWCAAAAVPQPAATAASSANPPAARTKVNDMGWSFRFAICRSGGRRAYTSDTTHVSYAFNTVEALRCVFGHRHRLLPGRQRAAPARSPAARCGQRTEQLADAMTAMTAAGC
jgi:hypothetical protein